MKATWAPHEKHGELTARSDLPDSVYAFPKQRKEPLTDARHVRNAIARFDQVTGVTDEDRDLAFANIKKAAGTLWRRDERKGLAGTRPQAKHRADGGGSPRSPRAKRRRRESVTSAEAKRRPDGVTAGARGGRRGS